MGIQSATSSISLNVIANEADISGSVSLSMFYAGGRYYNDYSQNSQVPTSGEIAIADFYGAAANRFVHVKSQRWQEAVGVHNNGADDSSLTTVGSILEEFDGSTVRRAYTQSSDGAVKFKFTLSGSFSQNAFHSITPSGGNELLFSDSTSFSNFTSSVGPATTWEWRATGGDTWPNFGNTATASISL